MPAHAASIKSRNPTPRALSGSADAIPLNVIDWGPLSYPEAHVRQLSAVHERIQNRMTDTVHLVEHPHVYTHGRVSTGHFPKSEIVLGERVAHVAIERGGDVTYHGPGQLVAYPIVDVRALTGDLHRFLRWLEDVLIATIAEWGILGHHHSRHTGVWVDDRKIASIGVAVRKWISYHGVALNVNTDLRFFSAIHPCGLSPDVMTSMAAILRRPVPMDDVKQTFIRALRQTRPGSSARG